MRLHKRPFLLHATLGRILLWLLPTFRLINALYHFKRSMTVSDIIMFVGRHIFSSTTPRIWNSLRHLSQFEQHHLANTFRRFLKTHLFSNSATINQLLRATVCTYQSNPVLTYGALQILTIYLFTYLGLHGL